MRDVLRNNKRFLTIVGGGVAALVLVLVIAAVVIAAAGGRGGSTADAPPTANPTGGSPAPTSTTTPPTPATSGNALPAASDVASVAAVPPVIAAVSANYPAIPAELRSQPDLYAKAFVTELFTQKYATTSRGELMSWAQYESTPVLQPGLDDAGRAKLPVISLTDLGWEPSAQTTPIPPEGPWLSLASQSGNSTVSDVQVTGDPDWEKAIAGGYKPLDPMLTVRLVSATLTVHTMVSGALVDTKAAISIKIQLGTSTRGDGYAFVASGSYVVKAAS